MENNLLIYPPQNFNQRHRNAYQSYLNTPTATYANAYGKLITANTEK